NLPMPAEGGNQIVIQATASVVVEEEGTYTFGINAVKGARLRIDGEDLIISETSLGKDAFGTLALTAGPHELELTVFQDPKTTGLGDRNLSVELFVAPGTHDAFSDAFALLGDGDKPFGAQIQTDVAEAMQDTSASLYARMPFQIEDPADVQRLTLQMQVDDGFVAYLNGVEVGRRNAPPQPTFDATATRARADYLALRQETIDLTSFRGLLNDGSNVLAIHALNRSATDADFLVVPELTMVRFGDPIVPAEPMVLQARTWRDGEWSAPATGSQNDILINEILARSGESEPDRIELLNTTNRPIDISGWLFTDDSTDVGRYPVPAGTTIDAGGYLSLSSTETGFQMDGQQGGQVWLAQPAVEARAMRFVDTVRFDGTEPGVSLGRWPNADRRSPLFPMTSQTFGEENSGPALGEVIISEVDYQPRLPASVPSITGDYELEFVELFGRSNTPVNLNGWKIDGGVLFTFNEDIELSEGQTVVLVGFDPAEAVRADAFRQVLEIDQSVRLVGPYIGRLANGGEQLRLLKPLAGVDPQQGVALVDYLAY
ncbi:MAG: lamin tail domain-containing protein, partial [Pirellulales bacterium]